jgi:protein SCO1/2
MKPTPSLPIMGLMLAALAAIAVASWVAWSWIGPHDGRSGTGGVIQASVDIGGPFELIDQHGKPVSDKTFRGQYMLIYFGYGFCPDVCPTELSNMASALDVLGTKAKNVQPIFITVDPERDTPEFLADYVANFHPRLIGLTGTPEQVKAAAKAYKVYYAKATKPGETDYLMDHTSFVYLWVRTGDSSRSSGDRPIPPPWRKPSPASWRRAAPSPSSGRGRNGCPAEAFDGPHGRFEDNP